MDRTQRRDASAVDASAGPSEIETVVSIGRQRTAGAQLWHNGTSSPTSGIRSVWLRGLIGVAS
jgi:hypothetical protein